MTKDEALKLALEALKSSRIFVTSREKIKHPEGTDWYDERITAIKEALSKPEQKYHRGDRLICLETEEYCVIHISGTDRQWVKFPDSHIGVYTNEQVAELFELLPKEPEQEPVAWRVWNPDGEKQYAYSENGDGEPLYTTPPQRKPLTDEQIYSITGVENRDEMMRRTARNIARWVEAAHGIKE